MTPANTLVILSDEHQARAMGCAGHPFVSTPNLDRLAARGTRFTNAVTPSPICVPARAAFATGQYVHRCRYWDNSFGYDGRVRGWGHALQEAYIPVEFDRQAALSGKPPSDRLRYRACADASA